MRFATYKGERDLSELALRLFDIKGPKAAEQVKKAADALLRANPPLRDLKGVPEGAPIVVPNVPGITPAETQPTVTVEIAGQLREVLKGAQSTLEQSLSRETEEVQLVAKLLKGREVKELIKEMPALEERLRQIAPAADARLKDIEALKQALKQGLAQVQKDLNAFVST